jgi:RecA/RadA recombinase
LIDSENALDEEWLKALEVDTSPEKLLRIAVSMIDDVAKTLSDFLTEYKATYGDKPYEEMPKMLFVIDSLGMLLTPTDVAQFEKGDMKGDMGRKPKALAALVRNTVNRIAPFPIGVVATNHTYASQDMFDPDAKISGGQGFIYASSIVVAMRKLKLKRDEDGNKITEVRGIRAACKVMKTRYSKPFESVEVEIPYESGMSPFSGLIGVEAKKPGLLERKGILTSPGTKLEYKSPITGEEIKEFRKNWTNEQIQLVLDEMALAPPESVNSIEVDFEDEDTENVEDES